MRPPLSTVVIRVILFSLGLLLFSACVHVVYEPPLPMPIKPTWHFFICDTDKVCLTQTDADLLDKWLDKLNAFEDGRQRIISGQEPIPTP
jgi:hypothetical protein